MYIHIIISGSPKLGGRNPTQECCMCQQAAIQCKSCTCQLLQISTSFYEVGGVCNSTHKFNESPNSTKLHELEHRKIPVV